MPFVVKDRVQVTSTTTGTGSFTLGAEVTGYQDFSVIQYSQAWNIATSVYVRGVSVSAQETAPEGIFFKPDGTKMYIDGNTGDDVNEYNLSTPWNISTASYSQAFVLTNGTNPDALFFKPDGLKMYVMAQSVVYEYSLSSAWNVSTATFTQSFNVAPQDASSLGLFFRPDGTKMYTTGTVGDSVYEYSLSSAWNISTASFSQSFSVAAQNTGPVAVSFKPDGTRMYVLNGPSDTVDQYSLSTAWNISTAVYQQAFSHAGQDTGTTGLFFNPDGSGFYIVGSLNDTVYQYSVGASTQTYYGITSETDWEIGIGTVTDSGVTLSRDTVLGSSNNNTLVNWSAGTKYVFCTFPADATEGTVPQGDTSQVGTDLVAWTNLKKELDRTTINGVPYNNNNTSGIASTFALVNTAVGQSYRGGVLNAAGEIHFIPENAVRGQKINTLTGVVSTYSLVYTNSGAYWGGVLAANGDIHFVPNGADRGQKISASGVVSTYSALDLGSDKYVGGVLAPNGDIHFIPSSASLGQKVSAAGVVSTYSLVYTTSSAYQGGVLASNGDIHFVPYSARVGQKISAAGVVSTYSLVYTTTGAYSGGVIAPNGDVHFINYFANRGQKVSSSGVVSTYSLVSTTLGGAYSGGALAPNGDIHFIPYGLGGVQGQKISAAGVVSTYSLNVTSGAYRGGVLASNGEIYFIANQGGVGQKISTGTTRNVGYALSPFFNKF